MFQWSFHPKSPNELRSKKIHSTKEDNNEVPRKDIYLQEKDNNIIMKYERIINLLDNTSDKLPKFGTKDWVEISNDSRGTYNPSSQIKCDYSDAYILVKWNITGNNTAPSAADINNIIKKLKFKNCAPITDCISKINKAQTNNDKDIGKVLPMYNLIEYSDNYSKTSRNLWQYHKDIPAVNNNGNIVDFNGNNETGSLKFKIKITGQIDNNGRIDNVEIMVLLKYLSNF